MNHDELSADLKLTNNGYLFAPTIRQLECARRHPELFLITPRGTIAPKGFVFERYAATEIKRARTIVDDFDYEGAILARQSRWMHSA